jgi:transposase-like protein
MEFHRTFTNEPSCEDYLIRIRWPEGMRCPSCGGGSFYQRLRHRRAYECRLCHHFTFPTAGTIFGKTRTSLHRWFVAMFLVAMDKRGLSALLLSKHLGTTYKTAWSMLQRMRHAMAKRDRHYKLSGCVEMDEMFVGAPTEGKKRGRGTEKTPILVAISFHKDKEGKERMGFAKLRAVTTIDEPTVVRFARDAIEPGSIIRTDGLSVYPHVEKHGFVHEPRPVRRQKAHLLLPHVHTYISNLRSFIQGTHHGLGETHLQQYLDEFCYRFNRRFYEEELFDRLLLACLEKEETPFSVLRG